MKNDLDRPLHASKQMREAGFFVDPDRMSNQDLIDECIALGTSIILGTYKINPADYYILAGDILECIEMSSCDTDTISMLMDKMPDLYEEQFESGTLVSED